MSVVEMKSLLESGVHFGHQTHRWNPKMKRYIFIKKNGIHIIDLKQSLDAINQAYYFFRELAASGKKVLFIGTKRQASEGIEIAAKKCEEFYVSHRWYGGTLTNLQTIRNSISKLEEFEQLQNSGEINNFTKLEILKMQRKYDKILNALGGIRDMERPPAALFVADTITEKNAVKEAQKLRIPIVAIVDTNCNPDGIDYVIPGNDDAIKSVNLICDVMANAIIEGKQIAAEGGDIETALKETEENIEEGIQTVKSETPAREQKAPEEEIKEEYSTEKEITKKEEPVPEKKELKPEKKKTEKKKFICDDCGKEFTSKRGLKTHQGLIHHK